MGEYHSMSESPLYKSTVLMSISNNKSDITNETHDEVNVQSINSEVVSSQLRLTASLSGVSTRSG
jgi:hypothetical protein